MRRTLPLLAVFAFALAFPWTLGAAAPPVAAPPAPAPSASGLPPGVHPLSPALAKHMDELVHAAEEYRGLKLKRPVPYGALDERGLQAQVAESLQEDLPADQMRALALSLRAFGLVPERADVGKIYRDLLGQQVAAFYDPEKKYLAMVERKADDGSDATAALGKSFGADLAARAEEGILVHELTHAIDDQYFDLAKGSKSDPLLDESAAYLGLVEGDATVTMFDYVLGKRIDAVPGFGPVLTEMMKDPGQLSSLSPDLPGSAGLSDAPAWFRDTLVFSYLQGLAFCLDVERAGGQKLLDYAFAQDPPRSTEQILHPEKWYGRRDDPVGLAWPDLAVVLPGFKKGAEGQLGEEGIGILLRQEGSLAAAAAVAAAGWGGDRFAVYEKGGKRLLLWITEWDTEADAAEFQAAAARMGAGKKDWKVVRSAPTRVVLLRGGLPAGQQAKVEAALAAVQAERPANRDVDFAALGIPPNSAVLEERRKDEPKPKPEDRRQRKPAREVHGDGRTFTDRTAGFSIRLPAVHEGWSIVPEDEGSTRVRLVQLDKGVLVEVRVDDLPAPSAPSAPNASGKLDDLLVAWKDEKPYSPEMRFKSGNVVERASLRAYERQFEAENGKRILDRSYLHASLHGSQRITLVAIFSGGAGKDLEGAVQEIFDSLVLLP